MLPIRSWMVRYGITTVNSASVAELIGRWSGKRELEWWGESVSRGVGDWELEWLGVVVRCLWLE